MKRNLMIVVTFVITVAVLTLFGPKIIKNDFIMQFVEVDKSNTLIKQDIIGIRMKPEYIYSVYYQDTEIGRLKSTSGIAPMLDEVYQDKYAVGFPDTTLSLSDDIHIAKSLSFIAYENKDSEILKHLYDQNYFAVEVNKVSLSNGAVFYVNNLEDFNQAQSKYVLNFISEAGLSNIQNKINTPSLSEYTSKEISIAIQETIEISRGYAAIDDILMNVDDIIYYLSYGYDTEPEYYTVQEYDTIQGIARLYGLDPMHIVMINSEINRLDQVLTPGMKINVTYYNSPLTIVVTRERLYKEAVYPASTKFIYDATLAEGRIVPIQSEKDGSADILMKETYINGVLMPNMSSKISSTITISPQQEIKKIGTKVIPGIGTGTFRWPVDNPNVTCGWWCYKGHKAADIQNRYNLYGKIYAADRGTVVTNTYDSISGYYIIINHGNGFKTRYGHMRSRSPINVGAKVDKGSVIGTIGATGRVTAPHVHFAIERNGTRVNPCLYLRC